MPLKRLLVWFFAIACGLHEAAAAPPPSWGLPQLMQELAQLRSASANFTERKTLRALDAPIIASGTLTYKAPDYIRKSTTSPLPEDFILNGDQVTLSGGPGQPVQTFSLEADPRIGGLVEGMRATLAGDLPTLQRFYTLRLTGNDANWQLLLRPKDAGLARFISWIVIRGTGNRIAVVDTASGNGDHSEMGISETASDAR